MRINDFIARFFSFLLQPMLMPTYSIALLFLYANFNALFYNHIWRFLVPVLVLTFVIPCLFVFVLYKMKYIRSLSLSSRNERILPYLIFIFGNISLFFFFYSSQIFYWFLGLLAAPIIIAFCGFIINLFWKISTHMLGLGGLLGGVMAVSFHVKNSNPYILFIALFILSGLLGVCRLYLRKNTAAQIYVGFFLGFALAYASVLGGIYYMLVAIGY